MSTDLPSIEGNAFNSSLSIPDFAACLSMGLRPVGMVQGFYYGQLSSGSNYSATPVRTYPCACMEVTYHQTGWLGTADTLDQIWMTAHEAALERMLTEAAGMGAHGVVGVTTRMSRPNGGAVIQAHLFGTAVIVEGASAPEKPWSTQLAGHKLAKLIEIGFVPSSVAYARSTAVLVEGCNLEYYGSGRYGTGHVVHPLEDAHKLARSGALSRVGQLGTHASLYDVQMQVQEAEGMQTSYITCTILGSFVRRVRAAMPTASPIPTVNLAS